MNEDSSKNELMNQDKQIEEAEDKVDENDEENDNENKPE